MCRPDHFVGSPPHWISAGIRLATLAEMLLFIGRGQKMILTRDTRAEFSRDQGFFAPTCEGGRHRVVDRLPWPDKPG